MTNSTNSPTAEQLEAEYQTLAREIEFLQAEIHEMTLRQYAIDDELERIRNQRRAAGSCPKGYSAQEIPEDWDGTLQIPIPKEWLDTADE